MLQIRDSDQFAPRDDETLQKRHFSATIFHSLSFTWTCWPFFCKSSGMAARKFTTKETLEKVLDSDFDPGEATQESQDEGDTPAHESQDEDDNSGDRNIFGRRENTDYMDRVIKKDATVQVQARRHGCSNQDSDSSFDASAEFERDETSPPQTLQELRGKKRARSLSPPAHISAKAPPSSPVPGPSSMV